MNCRQVIQSLAVGGMVSTGCFALGFQTIAITKGDSLGFGVAEKGSGV